VVEIALLPCRKMPKSDSLKETITMHFKLQNSTPSWYYGWNIVAITMVLQATTYGLVIYSFSFWVAPFREEFNISANYVMVAAIMINLAKAAYAPFLGKAMDSYSIRTLVAIGVLIFCVGMYLASLATAFFQIILIYSTFLAIALVFAGIQGAQTLTAKWFNQKRGLALGISAMGTGIGGFFFPPIVTQLVSEFGWRDTHVIIAIAVFIVLLPSVLFIIRNPSENDVEDSEGKHTRATTQSPKNEKDKISTLAQNSNTLSTIEILRSKNYWIVAGSFFSLNFAFASVQYNIAPIARDIGIQANQAAYFMSAMAGAMILGKMLFGSLSDKVEPRFLFLSVFSVMSSGVFIIPISNDYYSMLSGVMLMGFAAGGGIPIAGSMIASRFGSENFGQVMGLLMPAALIAIAGPTYSSWIRSVTDSFDIAMYSTLVFIIPTAIFLNILDSPKSPVALKNPTY